MTFYPSSLRARVGITPLHDRSVTFILGLLARPCSVCMSHSRHSDPTG